MLLNSNPPYSIGRRCANDSLVIECERFFGDDSAESPTHSINLAVRPAASATTDSHPLGNGF